MQYLCNQWSDFKNYWSFLILTLLWIQRYITYPPHLNYTTNNPHVTCAVSIIIFFICCQYSFTSVHFHCASATLSLTMLSYSSHVFSSLSFHTRSLDECVPFLGNFHSLRGMLLPERLEGALAVVFKISGTWNYSVENPPACCRRISPKWDNNTLQLSNSIYGGWMHGQPMFYQSSWTRSSSYLVTVWQWLLLANCL